MEQLQNTAMEQPRDRAVLVGLSSPRLSRKENADEESLEELGAMTDQGIGKSGVNHRLSRIVEYAQSLGKD